MGHTEGRSATRTQMPGGWSRLDTLALASLAVLGGLLRSIRINAPQRIVFDEFFYARDGCWYTQASKSACGLGGLVISDRDVDRWLHVFRELTPEHPPLGKWLIGAGIRLFGYGPGGWRIASVAAGTLTIAVLYVLTRKLTGSTLASTFASGLLALDFLHLVQSRLAMLEIFVAFFATAAFLCCAYERDRIWDAGRHPSGGRWRDIVLDRRWRVAAGVAGGAAAASKLSGWLVVAGVAVIVTAWEAGTRREDGRGRVVWRTLTEAGPSIAGSLVALPILLYVTAYAGRLDGTLLSLPWSDGSWVHQLLSRQRYMLDFHGAAVGRGSSSTWLPMLVRPALYSMETAGLRERVILVFGNPLLWWTGFAALAYIAVGWLRRTRSNGPEGLILIGFLATYGSWLLLTRARPEVFLYYFTPAVPFLYLGLASMIPRIASSRIGRGATAGLAVFAILAFAFFYPVLTSMPVSPADVRGRTHLAEFATFR